MTEYDLPPVPFALGMASSNGSPPFPLLVFDDGAAVALHSVRALATELGLPLPCDSVFALLQDWDRSIAALATLAQALAYDDRARGHRGYFAPEDLFHPERLVPETRQMFRLQGEQSVAVPVSSQGGAQSSLALDQSAQDSVPSFALCAVMGRMCRDAEPEAAARAIAGWTLGVELQRSRQSGVGRHGAPGSLVLGPVIVPAIFTGDLAGCSFRFATMGNVVAAGPLSRWSSDAAGRIAALSREALLLPGDIIVFGEAPAEGTPPAGAVDMLEATAPGFGQIKVSLR